jgi:hypothetical protein
MVCPPRRIALQMPKGEGVVAWLRLVPAFGRSWSWSGLEGSSVSDAVQKSDTTPWVSGCRLLHGYWKRKKDVRSMIVYVYLVESWYDSQFSKQSAIDARNPFYHACMYASPQCQQKPNATEKLIIKIDPKPLSNLITIPIKHQRRWRNQHSQKRKNRNPPPIPQLLKNQRRKKRRHTSQNTPKSRARRNSTSRILFKTMT